MAALGSQFTRPIDRVLNEFSVSIFFFTLYVQNANKYVVQKWTKTILAQSPLILGDFRIIYVSE